MTVAAGSDALAQDIIKSTALYAAATGSSNAFTVTLATAPDAYTAGMVVNFKANHTITGSATVNVNSLGAKTIKKNNDLDLAAGDIEASQVVTVVYDGTTFQMQSQLGVSQPTIVDRMTTQVTAPADLNENTVYTKTITGGLMGPGSTLHIIAGGNSPDANNNHSVKLKFGGTTIAEATLDDADFWYIEAYVTNRSASTQVVIAHSTRNNTTIDYQKSEFYTAAINTAANFDITITVSKVTTAGDAITLEQVIVMIIP